MSDPLPCPHCGSMPEVQRDTAYHNRQDLARCRECYEQRKFQLWWTVENWNRRHPWLPPEDVVSLKHMLAHMKVEPDKLSAIIGKVAHAK